MIKETINYVEIDLGKGKNRKLSFYENLEDFKETSTFSMAKNEVQDPVLEIDSTLQSPVDRNLVADMKTAKNPPEVSAGQRKKRRRNRMKKRRNALEKIIPAHELPEKGELSSTNQINIVSTQSLVDELREQENDYKPNEVQSSVQELGIYVEENLEESKTYCGKEKVMPSSGIVQKQDNSVELCKDRHDALSQAADHVSIGTSSAKLSDKRPVFINRVQEWKVKQASHDSKTSDSTSDCHPSSKQMTEKNEKFEDELKQAVEDSLVLSEKILEVSLAESKREETILSSDVDVPKQVSVSIINEKDNLLEISHSSPKRLPVGHLRKKLLILDVNGLLADIVSPPPKEYKADINISGRAIFKRPFCLEFLKFCLERFDVGIWSSRTKKNVERVINYLMGDMKHKLLFCWDLSHCTETGFKTLENKHKALVFKELRKIWEKHDPNLPWKKGDYNESNTLLLDDSPYKALLNPPHTAIFPYSYKFQDKSNNSLDSGGDLRVYLEELAVAENMQKYVEQHPFGQSAITERSLSWGFYLRVINPHFSLPTTR